MKTLVIGYVLSINVYSHFHALSALHQGYIDRLVMEVWLAVKPTQQIENYDQFIK